ncbi:hypothetical protein ATCC90586_011576 [Pythium insidiosum]|nr:hypothetical protein ATCC90586_011576 [Pythium insidiosum]
MMWLVTAATPLTGSLVLLIWLLSLSLLPWRRVSLVFVLVFVLVFEFVFELEFEFEFVLGLVLVVVVTRLVGGCSKMRRSSATVYSAPSLLLELLSLLFLLLLLFLFLLLLLLTRPRPLVLVLVLVLL